MSFYILDNPENNDALTDFSPATPHNVGKAPTCQSCGKALGMLPWLPPYRAEIEYWGEKAGDIVFGPSNELLVSEKFKLAYKDDNLNGLCGFLPVEITKSTYHNNKTEINKTKYYCVTIGLSRAAIDISSSGVVFDEPVTCNECRIGGILKSIDRIFIEDGTWSGEDIFFARGLPGVIITSDKFKQFFKKNGIENGVLKKASEFQLNLYPWEHE
jgi:hypothetical protein